NNELPAIDDETPFGGRPPLAEQDEATRDWIAQAGDLIDGPAVIAVWEDALNGPAWDGTHSWIHSDLAPPNLLVREGRLRAVLDFGATGLGDPATDLNPAWSIFSEDSRHVFVTWSVPTTTPGAAAAASRSVRQSGWFRTMPSQTQH